jgi:transposase-like protein
MTQRRRFSAEYKREAVAMLDAPCVSVSQVATEQRFSDSYPCPRLKVEKVEP